ncbi:MAG: hypothetical protein EPO35_11740 [Acidobacteria bacterium]|nr:MAG: hypothetical protein EPO35_11740 [Acidobacteriota bacterium]
MAPRSTRLWTAFAALSAIVWLALPAAPRALAQDDDVRGLWVLRSSLTSEKSIRQMVDTAKTAGFNTLLVQVRGRGDAYYRSRVEPRAAELEDDPESFDPLALTLKLAHEQGLRVHAWFNVDLVASATLLPRARNHVVARHPEWLMVPRPLAAKLAAVPADLPAYIGELARWTRAQSEQVEGLYLSPVTAASRQYTTSVVTDLAQQYELDGLHLDYVRYPSDQFDYSVATLAEFRAEMAPFLTAADRQRLDRLAVSVPSAWADALPDEWGRFRRARLTSLVASIRAAARAARPGLMISAAAIPDADEARSARLQDWREWARAGLIDTLCPMIYTTDAEAFRAAVSRVKADAGPAAVWAGIGAFRLTPARTSENLKAVRRAGVSGVLLYSYDSLTAADAPANYFALIRSALVDNIQSASRLR